MWASTILLSILGSLHLILGATTSPSYYVAEETRTTWNQKRTDFATYYDEDDSIYILGGASTYPTSYFYEILKYSISMDTIEVAGRLPIAVMRGSACADALGRIHYLPGAGYTDPPDGPPTIQIFDPKTGLVSVVGPQSKLYYVPLGQLSPNSLLASVGLDLFEYSLKNLTWTNVTIDKIDTPGFYTPTQMNQAVYDGNETIYIFAFFSSCDWGGCFQYPVFYSYNVTSGLAENSRMPNDWVFPDNFPWTAIYSDGIIYGFYTAQWTNGIFKMDPIIKEYGVIPLYGTADVAYEMTVDQKAVFVKKLNRVYLFHENRIKFVDLFPDRIIPIPTTTTTTSEDPLVVFCSGVPMGGFYPFPRDCQKFIGCQGGLGTEYVCPGNLMFDIISKSCQFPDQATCGDF